MKIIPLFKNESQIIKRAASNDRRAQRLLFEKHSPKMLSVCRQYISDLHHAEDVMIGGFFEVFENLENFRGEGSFEGWIRRIMIREAISFLRVQKKVEFREEEIEENIIFDPVAAELDAAHIQSLIDALPEGYRMVFVLYAIDGYKHSEIAKMFGISEGTSKSQLFKARKLLQEKLSLENAKNYGAR